MNTEPLRDIFLKTGDVHFGSGRVRLRTLLGSCVAVTLWHPQRRLGGMCHYLLSHRGNTAAMKHHRSGFYADEVIALLAEKVAGAGTRPSEYIVKLFGGGNMFDRPLQSRDCDPETCEPYQRRGCRQVPCANVLAATELLTAQGFVISGADTGGNRSRSLLLDLSSGEVWLSHGASYATGVAAVA